MESDNAGVVKLVDTSDSKSDGCIIRVGSIPTAGKEPCNNESYKVFSLAHEIFLGSPFLQVPVFSLSPRQHRHIHRKKNMKGIPNINTPKIQYEDR